jgi:hypothetical protein
VTSTFVTWPAILVAIPIGALAAWRQQQKTDAPSGDFAEQVSKLLRSMKEQFVATLGRQIKGAIESAIDVEISRGLDRRTFDITGVPDVQEARELESRLALMANALHVPCATSPGACGPAQMSSPCWKTPDRISTSIFPKSPSRSRPYWSPFRLKPRFASSWRRVGVACPDYLTRWTAPSGDGWGRSACGR